MINGYQKDACALANVFVLIDTMHYARMNSYTKVGHCHD